VSLGAVVMVGGGADGGWPVTWWLLAQYCGGGFRVGVGCRVLL